MFPEGRNHLARCVSAVSYKKNASVRDNSEKRVFQDAGHLAEKPTN